MNSTTCPHQKSYRFCIEPEAAIGTLETVLAIVRRLGLELRSIRCTGSARGMDVQIRIAAEEEEALTLCRMRLHNVVGILAIREMPSLVCTSVPAAMSPTEAGTETTRLQA